MRRVVFIFLVLGILTSCTTSPEPTQISSTNPTDTQPASTSTPEPDPTVPATTPSVELPTATAAQVDFFTEAGITLPAPTCTRLTQSHSNRRSLLHSQHT